MEERKKYRAIDPKRRILEAPMVIRSEWNGSEIIRGSSVIKERRWMDPKAALTIQFAHKIADLALSDIGIEVSQFKIIRSEPKKEKPNASAKSSFGRILKKGWRLVREMTPLYAANKKPTFKIKRRPGGRVLFTKRQWLDEISKKFRDSGKTDYLENDARYPKEYLDKVEDRLYAAGLKGIDIHSGNFAITREGKTVLFEVLVDEKGRISGNIEPDKVPNAGKISNLIEKYKIEMKKLENSKPAK